MAEIRKRTQKMDQLVSKKIIILHFREPRLYPPLLNFIEFLKENDLEFYLVTAKYQSSKNQFAKFWGKLLFVLQGNFYATITQNPIVCFESISTIALFLANKLNSKLKVYFHFHEYFSKQEYLRESRLEQFGWKLEKNILKNAKWISHTNQHRMDMWAIENNSIDSKKYRILPNYPSEKWVKLKQPTQIDQKGITKLVHIGALSEKSMYLENMLQFLGNKPQFSIAFYSHRFTPEISDLISKYNNCTMNGSISYQDIPSLKGKYDVGLVLYNGSTLNFTYNAPNKIFEYLALDLDVWCSDKLITAYDHERLDCYPKMIMVDYENLEAFEVDKALDKNGLDYVQSPYVCEPVYQNLLKMMFE